MGPCVTWYNGTTSNVNGSLFLFTGDVYSGNTHQSWLWRYNPSSKQWAIISGGTTNDGSGTWPDVPGIVGVR
jgi:hypothetical protein